MYIKETVWEFIVLLISFPTRTLLNGVSHLPPVKAYFNIVPAAITVHWAGVEVVDVRLQVFYTMWRNVDELSSRPGGKAIG